MKRQQEGEMPPRSKRRSSSYVEVDYSRQVVDGERREQRRPVVVRESKMHRDPRDRELTAFVASCVVERPVKRHKTERIVPVHVSRQERPPVTEYRTLMLTNINEQVPDHLVQEVIAEEFKRFGEFNVKLTYSSDQKVAYMTFRYPEDAKNAKHARSKLMMFEQLVGIESVYPKRSSTSSAERDMLMEYAGRDAYYQNVSSGRSSSSGNRRVRNDSFGQERVEYVQPVATTQVYEGRRPGSLQGDTGRERFPHHLHHILPEDDEKATRTLFVGNLDPAITDEELLATFGRYGIVEDIDIKRPPKVQGNAYAFLKFANLDMAHRAKVDMSGQLIGKYQCKIGYGKANPSTCLWVGGLGSWIRPENLEQEFDRFGVIHRIEWPPGKNYAYVLYDNIDAAQAACQGMRGAPLGGQDRRLRIDFTDPTHMDRPPTKNITLPKEPPVSVHVPGGSERREGFENWHSKGYNERGRGGSHKWGAAETYNADIVSEEDYVYENRHDDYEVSDTGDRRKYSRREWHGNNYPHVGGDWEGEEKYENSRRGRLVSPNNQVVVQRLGAPACSHDKRAEGENGSLLPVGDTQKVDNVSDLAKCLPVVWSGALILKNSAFAARMHLLSGDVVVVDNLMRDLTSTEMPVLKIAQRLPLDQPKLDHVSKRVLTSGSSGHSVLLAMPGSTQAVEDSYTNIQQRPLRNLMSYLKQKEAAGVVTLPPNAPSKDPKDSGMLYAFPPCTFSQQFLTKHAPKLSGDINKDDYLVVVVVRAE